MILSRWLGRAIQKYTWFLLFGLIFLVIAQRLIVVLAKVVAGKIPADIVGLTLLYSLPEVVGVLLPICFALAVLLMTYRLQKNHELEALGSLGFQDGQVFSLLFKQALLFGMVSLALIMWIAPYSALKQEELKSEVGVKLWQQYFEPGLFQAVKSSQLQGVIHVSDKYAEDKLLMANIGQGLSELVVANKPALAIDDQQLLLDTQEGTLYRFSDQGIKEVQFARAQLNLGAKKDPVRADEASLTLKDLWMGEKPKEKAELFWRLGMGSAIFLMVFLLIPLFRCQPRRANIRGDGCHHDEHPVASLMTVRPDGRPTGAFAFHRPVR